MHTFQKNNKCFRLTYFTMFMPPYLCVWINLDFLMMVDKCCLIFINIKKFNKLRKKSQFDLHQKIETKNMFKVSYCTKLLKWKGVGK